MGTRAHFTRSSRLAVALMSAGVFVSTTVVPPVQAADLSAVTNDQFSLGLAPEENGSPGVPAGYIRLWDVKTAWRDINPSNGVWNWKLLDEEIAQVERAGAKTLLVLGLTPQWAARDANAGDARWGAGSASPPADPATYSTYVTEVMRRYGGRIAAVEVWNEANLKTFWAGTPEEMADLTKRAHDAVKAVSPGTRVLAASTTTRLGGPLKTFFKPYVSALKFQGYPFDYWSIHSYPAANANPDDRYYDITEWWDWVEEGSANDPQAMNRGVWDTEVNYGVKGPGSIPDRNIDDATGAAWLARTYIDSIRAGISSTFWYLWTAGFYDLVGVQLNSQTPNQMTAYRTVRDWTAGATFKGCDDAVPDVLRCFFVKGDPFVVAYSKTGAPVAFDKLGSLPAQTWLGEIINPAGTVTLGDGPVKFNCPTGTDQRLCTSVGAQSVPTVQQAPSLSDTTLAAGDTVTAKAGQWNDQGSTITGWHYQWHVCDTQCTEVASERDKQKYLVRKADIGKFLWAFVSTSNKGGQSAWHLAGPSSEIAAAHTVSVPTSWEPVKKDGDWTFPSSVLEAQTWADAVSPKVPIDLRVVTTDRVRNIPAKFADDVDSGDVYKIDPAPGTKLTSDGSKKRVVKLYTYQESLFDGCPTGKSFRKWWSRAANIPLRYVKDNLEKNDCNWSLTFQGEPIGMESIVWGGRVVPDPADPEEPLLRVTASPPSDHANLSLLVGPPAQTPDSLANGHATLNTNLAFMAFDTPVYSSASFSVLQRNTGLGVTGTKFELYGTDGKLLSTASMNGSSATLGHTFNKAGTVMVIATVGPDKSGKTRQVYAKIQVDSGWGSGGYSSKSGLMLDGRCIGIDGSLDQCGSSVPVGAGQQLLASALTHKGLKGEIRSMPLGPALKQLAAQGNEVQVIVTNNSLSGNKTRYRECAFYDIVCLGQNLIEFIGKAIVGDGGKKVAKAAPRKQLVMPQGGPAMSLASGGCSTPVPGSYVCPSLAIRTNLINLDGSGLINLDGGTLINLDGGNVVGVNGATLINLDGGTLINLDGSGLINLDGGNVVGVNGATMQTRGPVVSDGMVNGQPAIGLIAAGGQN